MLAHAVNYHSLSAYYMPGNVLDVGNAEIDMIKKVPSLTNL